MQRRGLDLCVRRISATVKRAANDSTQVIISEPEERAKCFQLSVESSTPIDVGTVARELPGAQIYTRGVNTSALEIYFVPATIDGRRKYRVSLAFMMLTWLVSALACLYT
jgi:hypothetical protein